jgi:predicted DNA-binding transcriptional regulator YafY
MSHNDPRYPGQKAAEFSEKGWRLVRLWNILLLLAETKKPLSAARLNELVHQDYPFNTEGSQCSVQTTIEDLKTLVNCDFPISRFDQHGKEINSEELSPGKFKNTTWGLRNPSHAASNCLFSLIRPTAADISSLALCRAMLGITSGGHRQLGLYLDRLLEELQINLNSRLRHADDFSNDIQERIVRIGRKYVGKSVLDEHWKTITTAIGGRKAMKGKYRNRSNETINAEIFPLAVWFAEGRSYLLTIGITNSSKLRVWRPDRFSELHIDKSRNTPAVPDSEIDAAIRHSFQGYISEQKAIRLRASSTIAYMFREFQYHPSQEIRELEDGGLEVSLYCASGWGFEGWILGFGELITVEHPEELRQRIVARINTMMNAY